MLERPDNVLAEAHLLFRAARAEGQNFRGALREIAPSESSYRTQVALHFAVLWRRATGLAIPQEILETVQPRFRKKHGQGRRFTRAFEQRIRAAVASGAPSVQLERQLGVCYHTIAKFRRQAGDFENRRHRKKLSAEHIKEAEALRSGGMPWRELCKRFGCALHTLQKVVRFRCGRWPKRDRKTARHRGIA